MKIQNIKPTALLVVALMFLNGCAINSAQYVPYSSKLYAPKTDYAPIKIAYKIDEPYEEMGTIIATGTWSDGYEKVNELMLERAREIGADAVIRVRYHPQRVLGFSLFILSLGYTVAAGQGLAVKYKKNARAV